MAQCILLTGGAWNGAEWPKFQKMIGAYRVANSLLDAGYSVFVLDHVSELSEEDIITTITSNINEDTLWLGFSSSFYWLPDYNKEHGNGDILKIKEMYWCEDSFVERLILKVKSINPNIKIIYGGTKSEFFLDADKNVDIYVLGMADISIVDITNKLNSGEPVEKVVDSRKYKEPDTSNVNTRWDRPGIIVLDEESLPIELARGCIFKCKFCTYPLLGKKKGTYFRPFDKIREELISNYENFGVTSYCITDDTVNDDTDKLYAMLDMVNTLPFRPQFSGFFRLDLIHRFKEQAKLLVDIGVVGAFFGIETLQYNSAKAIGKGLHPNKVKDTLYWLREEWQGKINTFAGMILGLPYDDFSYFDELYSWMINKDCPIHHIQFYPLHLNKLDIDKPGMYVSEFNAKPEIYGYTFPGDNNYMMWELEQQGLSYTVVDRICKKFNNDRKPFNMAGGFQVAKYLGAGIPKEDLHTMTIQELAIKHNMDALNNAKLQEYRLKLGLVK